MAPRVRDDLPHAVRRVETEWIDLSDGTRLAARLWLPEGSGPVPAILEYLPYRLSDGTQAGDHQQMGWFAGHGYACARVDIRGTGNSGGIIEDEYSEQEQLDGLEVIAWLAAQPWCDGKVGIVGTSWSGFNGLQLAARTPPALGAVISFYASDDRYADDVHYRGGLVIPMDMAQWANCMLSWNALPPDPAIAGDDWRAQWRERVERTPHFVEQWLAHQRRDDYWRHGSACEHYAGIRCPVMAVGGWTDGYTDAVFRLLEHLDVPRRGLVGPWGHNDPVQGVPAPAVGSLGECVRFFDRWLKDLPNGLDEEPMLTAWLQDSVPPRARYDERPGRWVSAATWPPAPGSELRLHLAAGGVLAPEPGSRAVLEVRGAQTTGLDGGAWCADGHSDDLPFDQRADDGRSLCFDSEPLEAPLEILGHAQADLTLVSDRPLALVSVRLCELLPGGASLLVTRGQLNLTHREGHDRVVPLVPGEPVSRARAAGRDRPPLLGRLAPARRALADVLAAGLAVARAGHARSRGGRELDRAAALRRRNGPGGAGTLPARGAAGLPDDRARPGPRGAHDHARARQRAHRAALRLGPRRHEARRADGHRDHVRGRRGLRDRRGRAALGARRCARTPRRCGARPTAGTGAPRAARR